MTHLKGQNGKLKENNSLTKNTFFIQKKFMGFKEKWRFLTYKMDLEKHTIPIFDSASKNGKCPLLKTLLFNSCQNNCLFCPWRKDRQITRTFWETEKLVKLTIELTRKNIIKGFFLSSTLFKDPDYVAEKQIEVIKSLRENGYKNYIHVTLIPGTSIHLMKEIVKYANRVGINIETPKGYYDEIKISFDYKNDVIKRMKILSRLVKKEKSGKKDMVTQFIIGATSENDFEILKTTHWLYKRLGIKRVYYSAFEPIKQTPLENKKPESKIREFRLYQASFLIRDYNFSFKDFVFDERGFLINKDPKEVIAEKMNLKIDLEKANFEDLIKIPGVGKKTAIKILKTKNFGLLPKKALKYVKIKNNLLNYFN